MEEEHILVNLLINDLEDAEEQAGANVPRLFLYKNRLNPFEILSDGNFIKIFRLSKALCRDLIHNLQEVLQPQAARISALDLTSKVLLSLLFFASGSYQKVTGLNFFSGMSQSSVSRSINYITEALNDEIIHRPWIHFPENMQEISRRRTSYFNATGIPDGIGVIDCTHIAIVRPSEDEHVYVNRKHYYSLEVQLICDENLKIMNVNANFPGSTHDAYIWGQSNVSTIMERIYRNNNMFFLLGDSGYPLLPWLMTPFREPQNPPQERFNATFKSARSTIERCNGVLKNRFRCSLKHRVLHYKPITAARIVKACVVPHNMCIQNRIPAPPVDEEIENADFGMHLNGNGAAHEVVNVVNADLAAARILRQQIVSNHFNE